MEVTRIEKTTKIRLTESPKEVRLSFDSKLDPELKLRLILTQLALAEFAAGDHILKLLDEHGISYEVVVGTP